MAWKIAGDIAVRLRELLAVTGWHGKDLARETNVWPAQVSNWLSGKQRPSKSRLVALASKYDWPLDIFVDGGPMPRTIVNRPVAGRSVGEGGETAAKLHDTAQTVARLECQRRAVAALVEADVRGLVPTTVAIEAVMMLSQAWRAWEDGHARGRPVPPASLPPAVAVDAGPASPGRGRR